MSEVLDNTRDLLEILALYARTYEGERREGYPMENLVSGLRRWVASVRSSDPFIRANRALEQDVQAGADDDAAFQAERRLIHAILHIISLAARDYSPDELLRKELNNESLPVGW